MLFCMLLSAQIAAAPAPWLSKMLSQNRITQPLVPLLPRPLDTCSAFCISRAVAFHQKDVFDDFKRVSPHILEEIKDYTKELVISNIDKFCLLRATCPKPGNTYDMTQFMLEDFALTWTTDNVRFAWLDHKVHEKVRVSIANTMVVGLQTMCDARYRESLRKNAALLTDSKSRPVNENDSTRSPGEFDLGSIPFAKETNQGNSQKVPTGIAESAKDGDSDELKRITDEETDKTIIARNGIPRVGFVQSTVKYLNPVNISRTLAWIVEQSFRNIVKILVSAVPFLGKNTKLPEA